MTDDFTTGLQKELLQLQDPAYKEFHSKLLPTVDPERIIGIRVPELRKFAKQFSRTEAAAQFTETLPHFYYEENNLHMMLLIEMRDFSACLEKVETFLPYIDNWATCDFTSPKCFQSHKEELLPHIYQWLDSAHPYTVRYGIGTLMRLFLDEDSSPDYLARVAKLRSEEYYVNMMISWYFATALARQWDSAIPYLEQQKLDPWVHRKTIQKAIESYCITPEQKDYLRHLRKKRV
jgi:3-methyladenine DNA glycosylase AlkD